MTYTEYIGRQIREFKCSQTLKEMLDGEKYFAGAHDILKRRRTVIGGDGEPVPVDNLPNNRVVDNRYKRLVTQKNNYLLGRPLAVYSENREYDKLLNEIFNKDFQRLMRNIGEDALNCGLGWMHVYIGQDGKLCFRRFKPYEIIPAWADAEHTVLDHAIRIYEIVCYEGRKSRIEEKIELYDKNGVTYYKMSGGRLVPDEDRQPHCYMSCGGMDYNWQRIPLIAFKYNAKEIPLIKNVKTLQDGLNILMSNFQNGMEEDVRNTILVLKNYDGENLGEFRQNLAAYGAVKVRTVDGAEGAVETLRIDVNSENYKQIIELFKRAITENGMGFDASELRNGGTPNQMNIQSVYSDIDLDANGMETEFQAAFEKLLWFVDTYLYNTGKGRFDCGAEIVFNRDMLVDESSVIENCVKSNGLISTETVVKNHPWVNDVCGEMKRITQENKGKEE
ncbi:MAG: phage portal protein [Firmicutes bacterium]|nr:phage portal protein [Bacillota bacterium]